MDVTVAAQATAHPLVLYDGLCGLCDRAVRFILPRDRDGRLRFAPLQSPLGQRVLEEARADARKPNVDETLVLVEGGRVFTRSGAALRVLRLLPPPWPVLFAFMAVPRPLRDLAYDFVAKNRTRWFGSLEACSVPPPEWRERFVDTA